jgi:hypothetical protein
MRRKGLGELPVALFLMILSLALAAGMINMADVISTETTRTVSDVSHVIKAKTENQVFHNNYIPRAAEYSLHQKSYELGNEEGNLSWTESSDFTGCSGSIWCQIYGTDRMDEVENTLRNRSENYFQQYDKNIAGFCNNEVPGYELNTYDRYQEKLGGLVKTTDYSPATVNCDIDAINVEHQFSSSYWFFLEAHDNRFYQLFDETNEYFADNKATFQNISTKYHGNNKVCGDPTTAEKKSLESGVVNTANSHINGNYSLALSMWKDRSKYASVPDRRYRLNITERQLSTISQTFQHDTYSVDFYGSSYYNEETIDCCTYEKCDHDDDPDTPDQRDSSCDCQTHKYNMTSNIYPEHSNVTWNLTDTKYMVPTEQGWKNLSFIVEPYKHDYTQD